MDISHTLSAERFTDWFCSISSEDRKSSDRPPRTNDDDLPSRECDASGSPEVVKGNPPSDSTDRPLSPEVNAFLASLFDRYDLDETGLIDNEDEVRQLMMNATIKVTRQQEHADLDVAKLQPFIDAKIQDVIDGQYMDLETFKQWWASTLPRAE